MIVIIYELSIFNMIGTLDVYSIGARVVMSFWEFFQRTPVRFAKCKVRRYIMLQVKDVEVKNKLKNYYMRLNKCIENLKRSL